ncbi:MAG TPA: glutaredoxin family protein [Nevskiaceae bacterium]|nr:glutaredoxin family protein [Nevskiaceae bacterium]
MNPSPSVESARHWRLVSRPGCGLCHELAEALDAGFGPHAVQLEWVDVDSRADWVERWGLLIPVLLDEAGKEVCITRFDAERVAAALGCGVPAPRTR